MDPDKHIKILCSCLQFGKYMGQRIKDIPTWYLSWLARESRSYSMKQMAASALIAKHAAALDPNILVAAEKYLAEGLAKKKVKPKKPVAAKSSRKVSIVEKCKTDLLSRYTWLAHCEKITSLDIGWRNKAPYYKDIYRILKATAPDELVLPERYQSAFDTLYDKLLKSPEKYHEIASGLRAHIADPEMSENNKSIFDAFLFKLQPFNPDWRPRSQRNPPGIFKNPIKREPATHALTLVEHLSVAPVWKSRKRPRVFSE